MGLEEHGGLVAGLLAALVGQLVELLDGLLLGLCQAGLLGLQIGDGALDDSGVAAAEEVDGAAGDALGDALALQ